MRPILSIQLYLFDRSAVPSKLLSVYFFFPLPFSVIASSIVSIFFSCTLFHTYPKLVKTSWVHFHQSSDGLNRGKANFKFWASSACGVCVYHPCCVLLLCSSSLSHQFSAFLFLFWWFQLLLLDEDEELLSLPQRNYTPRRYHTQFDVFTYIQSESSWAWLGFSNK